MIAVFGGSFNPVTIAHTTIIDKLESLDYINKVIILPVGNHYKKDYLIDFKYRKEMLELAIDINKVLISDIELHCQLKTIESLSIIQKEYPNEKIAFVMGADNLLCIKTWYLYKELLKKFYFILFNRDDMEIKDIIQNDEVLKNYEHKFIIESIHIKNNISSTKVRNMVKNNLNCCKYINDNVFSYIGKNNLYK